MFADLSLFENNENYIEVVLTGGPSSGKTSSLPKIIQHYQSRNVRVLCATELATVIISGGLSDLNTIRVEDSLTYNKLQSEIILMQGSTRKHYQNIAKALAPEKVLIVYDRAECDCKAYMAEGSFEAVLEENNLLLKDVRDSYDLVLHLVTAADGAAEHYNTTNNLARQETVEEAISADRRTLKAWLGHPHLRVIDNSTDMKGKIQRVFKHIDHALKSIDIGGAPVEYERKFLLAKPPRLDEEPLINAKAITVEQTYLLTDNSDDEIRVRKWADGDQVSYSWTRKRPLKEGGREERESIIKPSEYIHLLTMADPDKAPIQKTRFCFFYEGQYCELDRIKRKNDDLWILEIETNSLDKKVRLPSSLLIEKEVTDDYHYSNNYLSSK